MNRIARTFANLREAGNKALVTFVTAGDPDYETSLEILKGLPKAGANIIELGMPFSRPHGGRPSDPAGVPAGAARRADHAQDA